MKNYRTSILQMLKESGKYKLTEATIRAQLMAELDATELNEVQFTADLKWLHDRGLTDFTIEHVNEVKRWFLTEEGRKR